MNVKLLTLLALGLSIPEAVFAQDSRGEEALEFGDFKGEEYHTFSSGSRSLWKFDNKAKAFKDWGISVGGGVALLQRGDLTSFYDSKITPGYNVYVSLDKQITHTFGLSLQYQIGKTYQKGTLSSLTRDVIYPNGKVAYRTGWGEGRGVAEANTQYRQVSILGDLNLSNIFRRVDNRSPYRWALHAYVGLGMQKFKTQLKDNIPNPETGYTEEVDQTNGIASFFYQGGVGLKYNLNKLIDIEARTMYIITGDDEFDGGGDQGNVFYNAIRKNNSDNVLTANLGLTFKLGKREVPHLAWYDPLQEIYHRIAKVEDMRFVVCEKGDKDNDGVCDDWDRQLGTPFGARVDGAGVALDMDLDGVIDLNDKCPTVPGTIENNGCPKEELVEKLVEEVKDADTYNDPVLLENINKYFEGIEFGLDKYKFNKAEISSESFEKLDKAAEIIKQLNPKPKYYVIGTTDARGTDLYNKILSEKRAQAVIEYLVQKGVDRSLLIAVGKGKTELKHPECNPASKCPEWKNRENRRVYFQQKK